MSQHQYRHDQSEASNEALHYGYVFVTVADPAEAARARALLAALFPEELRRRTCIELVDMVDAEFLRKKLAAQTGNGTSMGDPDSIAYAVVLESEVAQLNQFRPTVVRFSEFC